MYPGRFLACSEINKYGINRALGIKDKENGELVCHQHQTNEELKGIDPFAWEAQQVNRTLAVTEGQGCRDFLV